MLLSESSIRKIIKKILLSEQRSVNVRTIQANLDDGEKKAAQDNDTPPEDYSPSKKANVAGLKQATKDFISRIKEYAKENKFKEPYITSGFRNNVAQANVMFKNWKLHGGKNGGNAYLIKLYKDDTMAKQVGDSFSATGSADAAYEILASKPISPHASGKAIDLRSIGHPNIGKILNAVAAEFAKKNIKVYINDETKYKNPHYHVKVG